MGEATRVGKRGTVVIASLRKAEIYTGQRRAEFLLGNAVDARDYARVRREVARLGLDPDAIPHRPVKKR